MTAPTYHLQKPLFHPLTTLKCKVESIFSSLHAEEDYLAHQSGFNVEYFPGPFGLLINRRYSRKPSFILENKEN